MRDRDALPRDMSKRPGRHQGLVAAGRLVDEGGIQPDHASPLRRPRGGRHWPRSRCRWGPTEIAPDDTTVWLLPVSGCDRGSPAHLTAAARLSRPRGGRRSPRSRCRRGPGSGLRTTAPSGCWRAAGWRDGIHPDHPAWARPRGGRRSPRSRCPWAEDRNCRRTPPPSGGRRRGFTRITPPTSAAANPDRPRTRSPFAATATSRGRRD